MTKLKLKLEYILLGIFAISFISYQLIQDNIRTNFVFENEIVKYLLGVAPNFFPAIGIPSFFIVVFLSLRSKNLKGNYLSVRIHLFSMPISLTGLTAWEVTQIFAPYGYFDWHDILWTFFGAAVFYFTWRIIPNRMKTDLINP
jgi:hypothetical protein